MSLPPTYEESATAYSDSDQPEKSNPKRTERWSIREEIGLSRTQHVATVVVNVQSHIRQRAQRGLSRTFMALLPSDQRHDGQLVGYPDGEVPETVLLEGSVNSVEFWSQDSATGELQQQIQEAIGHDRHGSPWQPSPRIAQESSGRKSSFFGRKQSKLSAPRESEIGERSSRVNVKFDDLFFRTETELGLFVTVRAQAVVVEVDLR